MEGEGKVFEAYFEEEKFQQINVNNTNYKG